MSWKSGDEGLLDQSVGKANLEGANDIPILTLTPCRLPKVYTVLSGPVPRTKMRRYLFLAQIVSVSVLISAHLAPIHYTISRRGGSLDVPDTADLSILSEHLREIESRFTTTTRQIEKNTVVRRAKARHDTQAGTVLLGEVGRAGNWFATIELGEPAQQVNMDLDMLTADWWVQSTNSDLGSFFLDFNSKTYRKLNLFK